MTVSTQLRNQIQAAVDHAQAAHTGPLSVTNTITDAVVDTLNRATAKDPERERYVVTGPGGFTETFDAEQVDLLLRLGLIRHDYDGHVLSDGAGNGIGPLHHFYREAAQ